MKATDEMNVVCLAGGVGGAKLADGLAQILPSDRLTIIVNTGDDFQHLGLTICPDLDTVMYTLAGVANQSIGWGREGESWRTMDEVGRLGGPDWFRLGDLDLATHLIRTHLLDEGQSLTAVTRHLCAQFDIGPTVLPMSDRPAPTQIETVSGEVLPFQTWFVRERWQPAVRRILLPDDARTTPAVIHALQAADVVIMAPSNPFVSIDPILNVYPVGPILEDAPQAIVAVTPIIAGQALKGPAAKMMAEMALPVTAAAVAQHYGHLIDGFIYDDADKGMAVENGLSVLCTDTIMHSAVDRERLAAEVLTFAGEIARG